MSEAQGIAEKICPNCDTPVDGRYCKNCGNEHTAQYEDGVRHFLLGLLKDITHLDGKALRTVKLLLTKPGFLSLEYSKGIKNKYIDPLKLYFYMSATVVVVFLALHSNQKTITQISDPDIMQYIDSVRNAMPADSANISRLRKDNYYHKVYTTNGIKFSIIEAKDMYKHGEAYYESVQHSLPPDKKAGYWQRYKDKKIVRIYEGYDTEPYNFYNRIEAKMNLTMPKSFFFSIPVFIISLFILFLHKRNKFKLISHIVFALHIYSAIWFFIMFDSIVSYFFEETAVRTIGMWVIGCMYLGLIPYLYISMFRFYKENRFVTGVKTLLVTAVFIASYMYIMKFIGNYTFYAMSSVIP